MVALSDLPAEVLEHVLAQLSLKDLLRLRAAGAGGASLREATGAALAKHLAQWADAAERAALEVKAALEARYAEQRVYGRPRRYMWVPSCDNLQGLCWAIARLADCPREDRPTRIKYQKTCAAFLAEAFPLIEVGLFAFYDHDLLCQQHRFDLSASGGFMEAASVLIGAAATGEMRDTRVMEWLKRFPYSVNSISIITRPPFIDAGQRQETAPLLYAIARLRLYNKLEQQLYLESEKSARPYTRAIHELATIHQLETGDPYMAETVEEFHSGAKGSKRERERASAAVARTFKAIAWLGTKLETRA